MEEAQRKQKEFADQRRRDEEFEVGDLVWLRNKDHLTYAERLRPNKFRPKYSGPYKICEKRSKLVYRLDLSGSTLQGHDVFHIDRLKRHHESPEEFGPRKEARPPPILVNEQEEYEVEDILDMRVGPKGKEVFLVKWKGYPDYDSTWQSRDDLANAPKKLAEFEKKIGNL
jgi:hypothetical protein